MCGERVVVTGGAGFIGSHLVDALLDRYDVTVLDDFSRARLSNLATARRSGRQLRVIRGDVRNSRLVNHVLKGALAVFHEAAAVSVPKSMKEPGLVNDVNVNGTLTVLMAAAANHVARVVYASSCAIYGESDAQANAEDHLPSPASPYAASKLAGEDYCRAFYNAFGLETVVLRYFNVYGSRQLPGPYSGVIGSFLQSALDGLPLVIFGDGKQSRDFVHVSDVARANLRALDGKRLGGCVFNVGTGLATTINELARIIKSVSGERILKVIHRNSRPGDVRHSCSDNSLAKSHLGYVANVSLKSGLQYLLQDG